MRDDKWDKIVEWNDKWDEMPPSTNILILPSHLINRINYSSSSTVDEDNEIYSSNYQSMHSGLRDDWNEMVDCATDMTW